MRLRSALAVLPLALAMALPCSAGASLNQWHLVSEYPTGLATTAMATVAGDPGSLYVSVYPSTFLRSADGGVTWAVTSHPPCQLNALAVDPNDPMTVYVGCGNSGGMLKSTDGGATWSAIDTGLVYPQYPNDTPTVQQIVVDPADSSVYITTWMDELGYDVFASHDGGATWTGIHSGSTANGLALSGGRIYAYDGALVTSDDGGATWTAGPAGVNASSSIVADPADPSTLYALAWPNSQTGQAWVTTDGGATWTQLASAPAGIHSASALAGRLYLGAQDGVYLTTDQGRTWTHSGTHVGGTPINANGIAADPSDPGHVWVGADAAGVWETTFGADTVPGWLPYYMGGTLPVTDITPTSAVMHGVIAATSPGITGKYAFWWGTTAAVTNATPLVDLPAAAQSGVESDVSASLTGLQPSTTYHVHLFAYAGWWQNDMDDRPDDVTFTTAPPAPPAIAATPAARLRLSVTTGPIPVWIHWRIAPGTYAVCGSTVQASADGGPYRALGTVTGAVRRLRAGLAAGHAYDVRVRSRDCRGASGAWAAGHVVVRARSGAPSATYSGAWAAASEGGRVTTAAGARASFSFSGRRVGIVALRGRSYGTVAVYLDGERVGTVDLHASHSDRPALVYRLAVATAGRHTLSLRVLRDGGHTGALIRAFAVLA